MGGRTIAQVSKGRDFQSRRIDSFPKKPAENLRSPAAGQLKL